MTVKDLGGSLPSEHLARSAVERRRGPWRGLDHLELATLEWVDWFNRRRLHGAVGYVPLAGYEAGRYSSPVPALARTQQNGSQ